MEYAVLGPALVDGRAPRGARAPAEVRVREPAGYRLVVARGSVDAERFERLAEDALLAAIPGARLITYHGTGHCPHWEQPERAAGDIAAFAARVGGAAAALAAPASASGAVVADGRQA